MADRYSSSAQIQRQPYRGGGSRPTFLTRILDTAPNSTQLVGLMTLLISGGILLVLTGLTITATILGLIFFAPLILLSSPIWVPVGTVLFVVVAGFLTMFGSGMAVVAGLSWIFRYFKGMNPPGSGGLEYARDRVKDYAREFQSRVKDAAPGA